MIMKRKYLFSTKTRQGLPPQIVSLNASSNVNFHASFEDAAIDFRNPATVQTGALTAICATIDLIIFLEDRRGTYV